LNIKQKYKPSIKEIKKKKMAQLVTKKFKREQKSRKLHDTVRAEYDTFTVNGRKYIQIDTYGRENRQMPNTPSQKIQFDEDFAKNLVSIFRAEGLI